MKSSRSWSAAASTGKTALVAASAGSIIGGPLLGLTAVSFLATSTLLVVATPLFILCSPVLFGAACLFALVMLGFAAAAMALAWVVSGSFTDRRAVPSTGIEPEEKSDVDQLKEGRGGLAEGMWSLHMRRRSTS